MNHIPEQVIRDFVAASREVARRGLVRCSSGNMSLRLDGGLMLIKASRSWMDRLTADDVTLCRIDDGTVLRGRKPSVETGFHRGILAARPDRNVVLHFQSPYATVLTCRRHDPPDWNVCPEIPFYIGPVARVPYRTPGSEELAAEVVTAMRTCDMAVMQNHGQVTAATDLDHAIQNAEFFELACQAIVLGGPDLAVLPPDAVAGLLAAGRGAQKGV